MKDVRCFASCHQCRQTNEVSINTKTYSCMFCHYPNDNPFYVKKLERTEKMSTKFENLISIFKQYGISFPTKSVIMRYKIDFKEDISKSHVNRARRAYRKQLKKTETPWLEQKPRKKTFWEVKIDCVTACSKVQDTAEIRIKPIVKQKVQYLMDKFIGIEWLAYLLGEKVKGDEISWTVNDIHIPEQKVSSGNVWDINCPEYNTLPVIGVIHSHHGMGNTFSKTDHDFINENHDISLCMSKQGLAGQVRLETPCGSVKILNSKEIKGCLKIVHIVEDSVSEEFEKQIKNIDAGPKSEKVIKQKQKELTTAQKQYTNGKSVKEMLSDQFANCPMCGALIDPDEECPYCEGNII